MAFSTETAVLLAAIGLGVGAFGTLIGAGGGFILTPILLLLYPHDSAQTLTAISLAAVFFNAASGTSAYARQRRIDFRSGIVFALATLPGAIGGALVVGAVSRHVFDAIMGLVLALLAVWLLAGERWPLPQPRRHLRHRVLVDRSGERYEYDVPLRRGAFYSLGVGFLSSFLGIGGGVIHVPLLVRALGFPTHLATATSHFVLAIMAGTGTVTHIILGSFGHGHGVRRAAALSVGSWPARSSGRTSRSGCGAWSSSGCSPEHYLRWPPDCSTRPECWTRSLARRRDRRSQRSGSTRRGRSGVRRAVRSRL